jgi:hypothetical protein
MAERPEAAAAQRTALSVRQAIEQTGVAGTPGTTGDTGDAGAQPLPRLASGGGISVTADDEVAAVLRGERRWAVVRGDGPKVLKTLPDACVDAVVTDPPYPREYARLYAQIAAELPRVLKRGGSFLAIVPHYSLPQVLADVGQFLKYRWTLAQGARLRS